MSDIDVDDGYAQLEETTWVGDRGIYLSSDGQRRTEEVVNITHKKRRLEPTELGDQLAEWVPMPADDFSEETAREPPVEPAAVMSEASSLGKRKEYLSTTNPMALFRPMMGFFLDEIVRHEGLGDALNNRHCAHCQRVFTDALTDRIFKCYECGEHLQCESCCLARHACTPLHVLLEWNGNFWKPCTLAELGLVYQLGHGGFPCPTPDEKIHTMVVIEAPIIHELRVRYCQCAKSDDADNLEQLLRNSWYPATVTDPGTCATFRSLEAFRLYNVVGNMNVHDFIHALERMTDTTASSGMTWLPERYKQFLRMSRQWAFLKRLMRAGLAHTAEGLDKTKLGACAVNCWACPHDGRNLPKDWRDVDPKWRFLYMLLLAVDANFRLKNRMRLNEVDDPSLGAGWGYWVEPKKYKKHIKKYVAEKDISSCIAFAALLQKDTRMTTGLRCSGVGGCVCARHECMRPNGLGDLQKGERYCNMDYIVMSALAGFSLLMLTISYDIACQWKLNLPDRMKKLPIAIRMSSDANVRFALPVWHAASHNQDCQDANSLSFKDGVGKSDGEGVERFWGRMNPIAFMTKDAGLGLRADVIEDRIDNNNFLKNMGQGESLRRKLLVAVAERDRQIKAFEEVNRTLDEDVKASWKKQIAEWLEDGSKPNPYTLNRKDCPTEAEVRLAVRKDEEALMAGGQSPLHGASATAFLVAGIQIEDTQRRIIAERTGTVLIAADRENRIEEWRHTLLVKIARFRTLQNVYMPGAAAAIAAAEAERETDKEPPKPERVKLFMPSQMAAEGHNDELRGCVPGLLAMEAKLRVGQCENALAALRARLHAKRWLIGWRNENVTGQVQSTKARTLIDQVEERVQLYAKRYRRGRGALLSLQGDAMAADLRELKKEDVRLDGDVGDSDVGARTKLAMLGSAQGSRAPRNAPGTSKRVMSWIWTVKAALGPEEDRLHDSIRVEWSRALARKTRWVEEVQLLREEMRRVLRYLEWQTEWWRERVAPRDDVSREVGAGIRSYALKQASWHDRLRGFLHVKWNVSALTAAQEVLRSENALAGLGPLFDAPAPRGADGEEGPGIIAV